MLMDMFYHCVPMEQKQRVYFHSFMLDIHSRKHDYFCGFPMVMLFILIIIPVSELKPLGSCSL